MKKLICIFSISLFFFGCGSTWDGIINVSYHPTDPPAHLPTSIGRPSLYLTPVKDNREIALKEDVRGNTVRHGKFEEDPTLIYSKEGKGLVKTTKPPPEIIQEALEIEIRRLGIEIIKDKNLADGALKASIEKFNLPRVSTIPYPKINHVTLIEVHLELYQAGLEKPVWGGTIKGAPRFFLKTQMFYEEGLNWSLSMAIKGLHIYPGFTEALASLRK
ncbi:MAG: hypothetical protein HOF21_04430 [Nitrospina sp.]|jgi:hypothetical protein|nr:hypothetical protein [Nitrospina sp.]MBT7708891.1 hypothetical protein [Nitrospina sp.]